MSSIISNVRVRTLSLAVLSVLIIGTPAVALAATGGPNNGSTFATVTSGTGSVAWTSPSNAQTSDTNYATANLGAFIGTSQYLEATGFNFSIPSNATITGIQASVIEKASAANSIKDNHVFLLKGGALTTTDRKNSSNWGANDSTVT